MKKLNLLICLLISFNLFSQPFSLVKEINTTATNHSYGNSLMQRVGTVVYFPANDGINGNELWKSDGTNAGTVMVKDITPGSGNTVITLMAEGNGLLFFVANDGVNGSELWRSDGTSSGTYLLKDIRAGSASSDIIRLFFHNGFVYFGADDGINGLELWKSDGTSAGTVMVKDIYPGITASSPAPFSNPLYTFVAMGNDIYFAALGLTGARELWKSDGTEAGTVLVKDIFPGSISGISVTGHKAAVFNGKLYFAANDGTNGVELWATDGTEPGTYLVKDIVAGSGNSQPNNLIAFNGALYFTASSTNNAAPDLYKTDGTEAGTILVRDLVADGITLTIGNSATIDQFTVANGKLFFRGTGPSGLELYATDGTTAGTGLVKDLYPGTNGVNLNGLFTFNNNLYLQGTDFGIPSRSVLYKSDGSAAGTGILTDATGGVVSVATSVFASAGGRLFFYGNTNDHGIELWSTDGTSANTTLVKDINTLKIGTPNSGANFFGSTVFNGIYFYAAVDDIHGNELWKSDGTTAGTVMVKDIWPGKAPSNPAQFFAFGGALYFAASDGVHGTELWKTDGTEAGTVMVVDVNPGPVNSGISRFGIAGGYLYFTAYHSSYGSELWRSDGTAAGTNMVVDLVAGAATGMGINEIFAVGGNAYAIANIGTGNTLGIPAGNRLIKIDGATNSISDFAPVISTAIDLELIGTTLFISGRNIAGNTILWKSENGGAVTQVKILSTTATNAYQLTNCGGKLYFNASNGAAAGSEPWISDGTEAGTFMLKDINPGPNPSTPYQFVLSGGKVYFSASATGTSNADYELWATDGTTAGTYLVKDILPGTNGSRPNATISAFGNKVLFTANDGTTGYELWQSDGTAAGTFLLQEFNTNGDGLINQGFASNFPTDFVYSKLNDKIVFFARSDDKGLQLYSGSIASPYKYVNDNSTSNDVFTLAVGNNANNGSQSAPYATLSYAVSQANAGDTIYVDAGIYTEQVTIDKGITLIGAGSGVTIVLKPAVTNPPPGTFPEQGTIQTTQNIGDVHIRNMSVTGDNSGVTPIIIQSGGSVKNCRLIGGNQGIYFRVDPAIKSALIENNYINVEYIGINCQGSGLTATLNNNTIDLNNPSFAAGVFAGLDFGPLVRFTAFGNAINNYNAQGFLANSHNTNITQNSILGTGLHAIEQGTNSLAFATCNWYGTTDAGVIASKVSGFFSYTPYLTNGTNTITTYGVYGFQPVVGSCSEPVTNFYVNDNSRVNDVFTTAVGSNSNNGTSSAPFATLSYAISVAPANSVIHVDAGTYAEQVIIDRGIVINGAGKDLTLFTKPAAALVPAPGPFTEIGLFETTQGIGDVHIRNLSINSIDGSSQNVIIQSGGSVKNCRLLNGTQGIYFRVESAAKTALVESNDIDAEYIAINFEGAALSATMNNNTVTTHNTGFSAGVFSGYDFGPLPQFTATGNFINDFATQGIVANSFNSNVTQNSFSGTGGTAILQNGGNAVNATCNWYGISDAEIIASKISGNINYTPWLTSGTDNSTDLGFQPIPGACTGRQNRFYVNDNSQTGDVLTTAIGNNSNRGFSTAPFATISYAISKAQAGDEIYVDAGTYAENVIVNKSVTLRGVKYGQQPGASLDRGNESIVIPAVTNLNLTGGSIIRAAADNITIDGFTLNGDNPNLNSGTLVNGVDVNAATAIFNDGVIAAYLTVKNNIVKNTSTYGIGLFRALGTTTGPVVPGALFTQNRVDNIGSRGIVLAYSAYGDITNNHISRCNGSGTWFSQQNVANTNNNISSISGNLIEQCPLGMQSSSISAAASFIQYFNNEILGTGLPNGIGVSMLINAGAGISFYNNKISNIGGDAFYSSNPSAGTPLWVYNNSFNSISGRLFNNSQAVLLNADCNWLDGTNGSLIAAKVTGNVSYIPWLTDNTDTDPATRGFQPRAGVCNGTPVTITLTQATNINCFGQNTGAIDITVAGGTVPYGFAWTKTGDPGFTASTKDISGLTAGTYHVVLTDTYNSTASLDVILSEPAAALSISLTGTNITCFGNNNGNIIANVNGGTPPYIYQWSNGGTASSISGLAGGGYTVVVNDANGCNVSTGYNVLEPALLTVTITGTTASCNGSATAAAAGGTSPYTYLWSTGATTSSISNVPAGLYTLTVTDANGCTANGSYTITGNSNINPSTAIVNVSCFGTATGSITVTGAGGVAPRTYNINGSPFQANNVFSNLPAGVYVVGVKDANGCSDFVTRTITQPALLTVVLDSVRSACFGVNNGRIDITAGGGSGGKTYNWTGPNGFTSTTQDPNNIAGGMYALTVTDSKGCTANLSVLVPTWNEITLTESVTNIACRGGNSGAINITVSGGTGNGFGYSWTGPGGFTSATEDISALFAGNYKITVTDLGSGCSLIKTISITQPAANLNMSTSKTNATGCNSLGTITATGSGGTTPYQYSINGTTFQASGLFTGLYAGDFTVWVKDGNGCTQTKIVSITDNGRDEYEGNNNKNQAKTINTGANIFARIATTADAADWFKFTTGSAGNYLLTLSHPNTIFVFNMYPAGNNAPALVPVNSNATSKEYTLSANTEYFINVTGGYSYICYSLSVNENTQSLITRILSEGNNDTTETKVAGIIGKTQMLDLTSVVYPNPHLGNFIMQINAPESGLAQIKLITAEGKILSASNKMLMKGNANMVNFNNIREPILFYIIRQGTQITTGKVFRQN